MEKCVVTLGEIMLRLKSPGFERLFQSNTLEATFGGGEANVAMSLSNFGLQSRFVSAIPDNPVGDEAIAVLKSFGVDTSMIVRSGDRLGIYFLEAGANQRASKVIYDRANSAIAEAKAEMFDFNTIFKGATWFHITGITPALSEGCADLTLAAMKKAKEMGLTISVDLNYRKKLWKYGKSAPEVMREVAKLADVLIGNEEDCQKSLGIEIEGINVESGELDKNHYIQMTGAVFKEFPNVQKIAITLRESHSATHNDWSALIATKDECLFSKKYYIRNIVDRVGGGDSFAAGMIFGLNTYDDNQSALEYAVAASCLKHSIPGDINRIKKDEVLGLMKGDGSGRVQR